MMNDLLPCPFCGGAVELNSCGEQDYVFTIACENKECAVNPRISFDEEDRYNGNFHNIQDLDSLYAAWNTRTPNKSAEVDLDALKSGLYKEIPLGWNGSHAEIEKYNDLVSEIIDSLHSSGHLATGKGGDVVPGAMRCAKCNFRLQRNNIYVQSGTIGPGDNKTETCPNGCGPLWPVTWKEDALEGDKHIERLMNEIAELKAEQQKTAEPCGGLHQLCHEAYEVYVQMEGGEPETAYEGYLLQEIKRMADLIVQARNIYLTADNAKRGE